jgi:hypothetical protein
MDAFPSVGLAGNVAQFVDFGCKLFSTTRQIHTSRTGLKHDAEKIEFLTLDLQSLCAKLETSLSHEATSDDEVRLITLGLQCKRTADKLLEALATLKPKKDQSKWRSFRAALKTIWGEEEIRRMHDQLNEHRLSLTLRLQVMAS